jgi:hypothetical protein
MKSSYELLFIHQALSHSTLTASGAHLFQLLKIIPQSGINFNNHSPGRFFELPTTLPLFDRISFLLDSRIGRTDISSLPLRHDNTFRMISAEKGSPCDG